MYTYTHTHNHTPFTHTHTNNGECPKLSVHREQWLDAKAKTYVNNNNLLFLMQNWIMLKSKLPEFWKYEGARWRSQEVPRLFQDVNYVDGSCVP